MLLSSPPRRAAAQGAARVDTLPTYPARPILVEAERWDQLWLPMASTVLERSALERPGTLRLAEALRPVVGLRVARYGGVGSFMPVSIRGSSNEQIVVLVDGRRLSGGRGGGVDLGRIDPQTVERVEVLRGAASALHGADAMSGIVAVTTRPAGRARGTRFHLEGGSLGTMAAGAEVTAPLGAAARYWLRGHGLTSDGDYTAFDPNRQVEERRDNAHIDAGGGLAGVELRRGPSTVLVLDGMFDASDQGVPGPLEFPTPRARRTDRTRAAAFHLERLDPLAAPSRFQLSADVQSERRHYSDPDQGIDDRHDYRALGGEGQLDRTNRQNDTWTFGLAARRERLDSTSEGRADRSTGALFLRLRRTRTVHDDWQWTLGAAARLDALSGFAPFASAQFGVTLTDPGRRRWRLGAGRAFRTPSFTDLFMRELGGARGNPDLLAERAFEVDGGVMQPIGACRALRGGELEIDLFWNAVDQLIQWVPGVDAIWRPHNVGLAILRGVEIEAGAEFDGPGGHPLRVVANVSWLDARDRSGQPNVDGRRLPYRPHARGNLDLTQTLAGAWRTGVTWSVTSSSFITAANTKRTTGYGLVDLRLERDLGRRLTWTAAVLNATDQPATDVRDYPLPGREWRLGVRLGSAPNDRVHGTRGEEK